MKKYYYVSFKWSDGEYGAIYCSNIVLSDSIDKIKDEYSKYSWYNIRDIQSGELEMAKRKGMPIIEL